MGTKLVLIFLTGLLSISAYGQTSRAVKKADAAKAEAQFEADRTAFKEELKKSKSPSLTAEIVNHKYGVFGVTAICQVNYKKLIELAEDKNLTESARTEKELPLLAKETDKRCRKVYYEYVDICAELRSRNKPEEQRNVPIPPPRKVN